MSRTISPSPGHRLAGTSGPRSPLAQARPADLLDTEVEFYEAYSWCLNPFPTVRETIAYLNGELDKLAKVRKNWQALEVRTNVYLLSCALLNSIDEYLRGGIFKLPR